MSTFLTVERARELPVLAEADDAYLAHLVTAACEVAERYCKRTFALTSHIDEAHDGNGEAAIFLRNFPVTEITSVTVVEASGEVELAAGSLELSAATGELRLAADATYALFPRGFGNVRVTYTAGFSDVPQDLQEAAASVAAWLYAKASHDRAVSSEKLGDYARSFEASVPLPETIRRLLAPYRNVRV